ncbi:FimB/Mfa2 family fimbrial subunit [Phocaeicola coprocola]|uniref:FimB/Mfa2 family fimbrial subunit n=1 Tax=Phocaeicola coprocola TaxID=310298 RepID=UPI00241E291D|nr:FimB/Mfa2 family fimbrial subunit [Phocaeicola coprocola]
MNLKLSNTIKGMLLFLACLATAGCGQEDMPTPDTPDDSRPQVVLTFSASPGLTTRTQLPGPEYLQHVQTMHLYIFNGTGDNAPCVAYEEVDWTGLAAPEGKPGVSKNHKVQYKDFVVGQPYTFIAVGLDDCSGATYDLPGAVTEGSTLKDAKAVLASGKTRNDIAVSELFGGSLVLTPVAAEQITGTIKLDRRVAGVFGYFKNIPTKVGSTPVKSLRIELYKPQNKSIWLTAKPTKDEDVIMEPIANTDDNKILVEIPLTEADFEKEKVLSKGSYVLPMKAPTETEAPATLLVTLADANGVVLQSRNVKYKLDDTISDTSGGTGIITVTKDLYRFAINANWFYQIGPVNWPEEEDGNIVIEVVPDWDWSGEMEWQ